MNDETSRPALAATVENMAQYDTVVLAFPIWWGQAPRLIETFVEAHDLSGKTVVPFSTHGGSGLAGTIATIEELQPDADVLEDGFTVSRNNVAEAEGDVVAWLTENGFVK